MAAEAVESAGWLAPGGAWLVVGALAAAGLFNALYAGKRYATDGEGTAATELISGALEKKRVKGEWKEYDAFFTQNGTGDGVPAASDKSKAPGFVDKFYNLVTDIYEWGWGESFHFSPALPGRKSDAEATRAHEAALARACGLREGRTALDAGCGVGGPMRNIARATGGKVTGLTINEYQVQRCEAHNRRSGLEGRVSVVQGNFLSMPFEDASFDCAYSIEATCHAPNLESVYGEIHRVLKPGGLYATYEWLTTDLYDKSDPRHVRIIDSICHGNALPDLRTLGDALAAAKAVGFEVVEEADAALPPALPWYRRLNISAWEYRLNGLVVRALTAIGVAPQGTAEVHKMLVEVARDLAEAGELGIFTPMHRIVLRKRA
uniref:Methyltransferase n=1 Tax=Prasinoderma coloniale TaxID=156133 RepID=A0A7R9XUM1_9VIRI